MRDVGIEIKRVNACGKGSRQFLPATKVRNLIIYEYVTPLRVYNLMGILVTNIDKVTLAFHNELGLEELVKIWKQAKKTMNID